MDITDKLKTEIANAPPPKIWTPRPGVLLCANTVKPMHGVVPRVILGQAWWDATRKAAYGSTDYHCIACGVHKYSARFHKWLEGHELYRTDYRRGRLYYLETVPLCHACHCFIHDGRLQILLLKKEITQAKFDEVMTHGNAVLKANKLKKKTYNGPIAEWSKWRLVLNGERYPPLYKSYDEWVKAFNPASDE